MHQYWHFLTVTEGRGFNWGSEAKFGFRMTPGGWCWLETEMMFFGLCVTNFFSGRRHGWGRVAQVSRLMQSQTCGLQSPDILLGSIRLVTMNRAVQPYNRLEPVSEPNHPSQSLHLLRNVTGLAASLGPKRTTVLQIFDLAYSFLEMLIVLQFWAWAAGFFLWMYACELCILYVYIVCTLVCFLVLIAVYIVCTLVCFLVLTAVYIVCTLVCFLVLTAVYIVCTLVCFLVLTAVYIVCTLVCFLVLIAVYIVCTLVCFLVLTAVTWSYIFNISSS